MPSRLSAKHQLLRQVKAKSLSVKIPKNEPNTARLSWVLANEEFLTVEIPRHALERFMVQAGGGECFTGSCHVRLPTLKASSQRNHGSLKIRRRAVLGGAFFTPAS